MNIPQAAIISTVFYILFVGFFLLAMHYVIKYLARFSLKHQRNFLHDFLLLIRGRLIILAALIFSVLYFYPFFEATAYERAYLTLGNTLITLAISLLLFRLIKLLSAYIKRKYDIARPDNIHERKVQTQFKYIESVLYIALILVTLAAILVNFDNAKKIGLSLLASAGLITAILAFAAQKTMANFLAGLQIAFTQPIKIDDLVVIEDEFGRVEDITLTYIVILLWDKRRLILPINYILEKSFQNWTYSTTDLIGAVLLYIDYTADIQAIRHYLDEILRDCKDWDGKVKNLQVTDTKEDTMELRVLVSAADAGSLWNLRCQVRELLIQFIQNNYPESLPRKRLQMK